MTSNSRWPPPQFWRGFLRISLIYVLDGMYKYVCVPMLTHSTIYYVLQVLRKTDRWHWVWSIFKSCTAWGDHITCGISVECTLGSWGYGDCMCNCLCSVIYCVVVGWWWWRKGRRWNLVLAHSLLFSKSTKRATRLNVPILQMNRYQQYCMPFQRTYCWRVWNLIQACDVQSSDKKVFISTPRSPEVENFQMKIYYPAGDRTLDLLNQRQTFYHLS